MTTRGSDHRPHEMVLALDVDGVILDPGRGGKKPWQSALREEYGLDPSLLDEVFFRRSWSDVIVGRELIEPALARALSELGWEIDVEAVLACWFEADFAIDREVVAAVNEWTAAWGFRLALVTNQGARHARFLELNLQPILPVKGVAFSGALGVLKNDPAFYPAAERWLGIEGRNRRIIFVDDSRQNVEAATRHGWEGVHFDKRHGWRSRIGSALRGGDRRD
jgi:putative hydrolase of the HAD superfamily